LNGKTLVREKHLKSAKGRTFVKSLIKISSVGLVRQPADDRQGVTGKFIRQMAELQYNPHKKERALSLF